MRNLPRLLLGALLGLALLALPAAGYPQEAWTGHYPLLPEGRVLVANVQGSIRVVGWDRPEVELRVVKSGEGAHAVLSDAHVLVESRGDLLAVRTLYRGQSDDPVRVDYYLRVPRQVHLEELRTVSGDIVVRNIEGSVTARTLNGNIEEEGISGRVVARTVNGNIRVALRALPEPPGTLQLDAINGDLWLQLPSQANARLELSTVAGRIESAWPWVAARGPDDTTVRTRLGRGGVAALLRTIRGNIHVRQEEDVL